MYRLFQVLDNVDKEAVIDIMKLIAKVDINARYETARQILELIGLAKKEKLSIEELENIIIDYVDTLGDQYELLILDDYAYKLYSEKIRSLKNQNQ